MWMGGGGVGGDFHETFLIFSGATCKPNAKFLKFQSALPTCSQIWKSAAIWSTFFPLKSADVGTFMLRLFYIKAIL